MPSWTTTPPLVEEEQATNILAAPDRALLKEKSIRASPHKKRLHLYRCKALRARFEGFHKREQHKIPLFDEKYLPNPWVFQYDLEFQIFLDWKNLKKEALALAESDEEREWIEEYGPTGLQAHEHLFLAAEIRWPIERKRNGAWLSKLCPHPWIEDQWKELIDWKFLIVFGGGGQGKTHGFAAFLIMLFDHFIGTANGAKCCFSTVNEDKLKSVIWPYVSQRLYPTDKKRSPFSLYAGRGNVGGDYTIFRFGDKAKDTGGVMQGILVGASVKDATITDKLTGSHGHIARAYLMDEMQSTRSAPMDAAQNYLSTALYSWVFGAGNYGEDGDLLGTNAQPEAGWDSVDEATGKWVSMTQIGHRARVIHQNNELSPAMLDDVWVKRCVNPATGECFLPNKKRRKELYPTKASRNTNAYRRFWIGFRDLDATGNRIVSPAMVEATGCDKEPIFDPSYPIHHALSFDPAQAQGDRNMLLHFADGIEMHTNKWVWAPLEYCAMPTASHGEKYYREGCDFILKFCQERGISSGKAIMDWTSRTSHVEMLSGDNFRIHPILYGVACPDGKTPHPHTGIIDQPICIEPNAKEYVKSKFAHKTCVNMAGLMGWLLQQYVTFARLRNINRNLLAPLLMAGNSRTIDKELYLREFEYRVTGNRGDRFGIKSKEQFIKAYSFSPDILDCLLQASYYMLQFRGMVPSQTSSRPGSVRRSPNLTGTSINSLLISHEEEDDGPKDAIQETIESWSDDPFSDNEY